MGRKRNVGRRCAYCGTRVHAEPCSAVVGPDDSGRRVPAKLEKCPECGGEWLVVPRVRNEVVAPEEFADISLLGPDDLVEFGLWPNEEDIPEGWELNHDDERRYRARYHRDVW